MAVKFYEMGPRIFNSKGCGRDVEPDLLKSYLSSLSINKKKLNLKNEGYSLDRMKMTEMNMTKNGEHDRKIDNKEHYMVNLT